MEQTLGPNPGPRLGYTKLSVFVIYSLFILKKSLCYPPDERRSTLQTKFGSKSELRDRDRRDRSAASGAVRK